ncbi:MAG: hypothetical protein HY547_01315, partial [Elusimicrobia bacterium]|nr:hypothetical protein [Elusimicrobiota bacterium]
IAGSLTAGFSGVILLGTRNSFFAAVLLNFSIGAVLLAAAEGRRIVRTLALAAVFMGILAISIPDPLVTIIETRLKTVGLRALFHEEDRAAMVTGAQKNQKSGLLLLNGIWISGTGQAGRIMAKLPILFHENPQQALIVGFGVGHTFATLLDHGIRVDAAELIRCVPRHFGFFYPEKARYLNDPRARIIFQDARAHLLRSKSIYDVIIVDGSPPIFSAGTVNLYTREFVQLAKSRLREGGILLLWVPLPCFPGDFWMVGRNMAEAFSRVSVFAHESLAGILILGSEGSQDFPFGFLSRRHRERGWDRLYNEFNEEALWRARVLTQDDFRQQAHWPPLLTDNHPYTEFPLARFWHGETMDATPGFLKSPLCSWR